MNAEDAAGHQQQQDGEFFFARLDAACATRCGERNDGRHEHQEYAHAIHAHVKADAEGRNPLSGLHEGVAMVDGSEIGVRFKLSEHKQRQHQRSQRGEDCAPSEHSTVLSWHGH